MAFHDTRFPTDLSLGALGGPERRTEIVTLANGFEERNAPWSQSRRRYDAGLGLRSLDDLATLLAFWEARMGQLHSFRWKDHADFLSCAPSATPAPTDQLLGHGNGMATQFQLRKGYASGAATAWRIIRAPVPGTVRVAVDGVERAEGTHWTLDATTGLVTVLAAPPSGAAVTAGFEFDVPVRFDTDAIRVQVSGFAAGEVPAVPVVEVRS